MWPEIRDRVPLHPFHLRGWIEVIIEGGEDIVIVTQSPIVISCFKGIPENIFICDGISTYQLIDKYDKEWLENSNVDLGELYSSGALEDRDMLDAKLQRMMEWI